LDDIWISASYGDDIIRVVNEIKMVLLVFHHFIRWKVPNFIVCYFHGKKYWENFHSLVVLLTTTTIEHLSNIFAQEICFVFATILITYSQLGYFELEFFKLF
jgi:hypothetical protein